MQPGVQSAARIPVDLVTGFLGSGKTTLINVVLREPSFAGALVIVNEFGEVGIDQQLFAQPSDDVVLLDSGCLCCAATGSLKDTLIDLVLRRAKGDVPAFSRVIVETSGLANPAPLVGTLLGDSAITARFELHQVLTLIDALHGVDTLARYREARYQVAHADRLLITKAQLVDDATLQATVDAVRALNPHAWVEQREADALAAAHFVSDSAVAATRESARGAAFARLPGSLLRGPLQPQYASGDEAAEAEADAADSPLHEPGFARIRSYVIRLHGPLTWEAYGHFTALAQQRFGKRLLRCKGFAVIGERDEMWVVQGVQGYFARPQHHEAAPREPASAPATHGVLVCIAEDVSRDDMAGMLPTLSVAGAELVQ
ncbi:MAG TPA: GTP-binding protein [Paraburkholderia sp.]